MLRIIPVLFLSSLAMANCDFSYGNAGEQLLMTCNQRTVAVFLKDNQILDSETNTPYSFEIYNSYLKWKENKKQFIEGLSNQTDQFQCH